MRGRALGMQTIDSVQREALLPSVEQRSRDPGFTTGSTDVAQSFSSLEDMDEKRVPCLRESSDNLPGFLLDP